MNPDRIPATKNAAYRQERLIQQNHICPLCGFFIDSKDAVTDHDHKTYRHRAVLHRGCNSLVGKLENNYKRFGVSLDQLAVIAPNVYEYITQDYSHNPFHYTLTYKKQKKPCTPKQK